MAEAEGRSKVKYQDLSAYKVPPGFRGRSAIWLQLWWAVQATVFFVVAADTLSIQSVVAKAVRCADWTQCSKSIISASNVSVEAHHWGLCLD